jgi:hypothetical protein
MTIIIYSFFGNEKKNHPAIQKNRNAFPSLKRRGALLMSVKIHYLALLLFKEEYPPKAEEVVTNQL